MCVTMYRLREPPACSKSGRKPSVPASAISHELICSIAQKGVKDKLYLRDDIDRIGTLTLHSSLTGSI